MPFYCGKRSADICIVLGPKKSSTYCREYASGFSEPAALHLRAARSPRNEGLLGQTPDDEGDPSEYPWMNTTTLRYTSSLFVRRERTKQDLRDRRDARR